MKRLAVATCAAFPALAADDTVLLEAAAAAGLRPFPVVWDATRPEVLQGCAVLLRSTWDYHLKPDVFRAWLAGLEQHGIPVFNPLPLVRWNLDKRYLRELSARGVPVVTTHWVETPDEGALRAWLVQCGAARVVVKPAVGANASGAAVLAIHDVAGVRRAVLDLLGHGAVMVQPFVDAVIAHGEWGLVFVDGEFSHAVNKRPAAGDYRVQESHGGTSTLAVPPPGVRDAASHVLAQLEEVPLYARVDVVLLHGAPALMELELVEPSLFLTAAPGAAQRLVEGLVARLGVARGGAQL